MAVTEYKLPTSTGETYNAWTNPTNAYTDDGSYTDSGGITEGSSDFKIALSYDGGSNYTSDKTQSLIGITTPTVFTLGDSTDTWTGVGTTQSFQTPILG